MSDVGPRHVPSVIGSAAAGGRLKNGMMASGVATRDLLQDKLRRKAEVT